MQEHFVTQAEFRPIRECGGSRLTHALVAHLYGVAVTDLFAATRGDLRVVFARQITMYLMHVVFGFSLREVGRFFGRDHSTAFYACQKIEDLREDPCFDRQLTQLEILVRGAADIEVMR